jgi:hypothetical protein
MRPALPLLLAAVASVALAAPATAKELTRVTICGQRGDCATIVDAERLRLVPVGGATSIAAPRPEPFYWMTLTIAHGGESEEQGLAYLPESNLLAANGVAPGAMVWLPIGNPRSAELMRAAVQRIEPHPAPPAWPRELKSTYRVIPDDAIGVQPPPSRSREAAPNAGRSEDGRPSVVWLAAALALALGALASLLGRLPPHQAGDEGAQALAFEHAADAFGDRQLDPVPVREVAQHRRRR